MLGCQSPRKCPRVKAQWLKTIRRRSWRDSARETRRARRENLNFFQDFAEDITELRNPPRDLSLLCAALPERLEVF
jgi:hypothetical protein